jgi:hypothetical protein
MKKFFAVIGKNWHDKNRKGVETCHSSSSGAFNRYVVIPGDEKVARDYLKKALKLVKHPHSKILVKRILSRFDDLASSLGRLMIPNIPTAKIASKDFTSPHWLKALVLNDFQLPRKYKQPNDSKNKTELRIIRDNKNIYIKLNALDSEAKKMEISKKLDNESFPMGEHFEILLKNGYKGEKYFFAFDANGNQYDAKNWDKRWNGNWTIKTLKTSSGWQAIVTMPINDIKSIKANDKIKLEVLFARINQHNNGFHQESTFKGSAFSGPGMHPLNLN